MRLTDVIIFFLKLNICLFFGTILLFVDKNSTLYEMNIINFIAL